MGGPISSPADDCSAVREHLMAYAERGQAVVVCVASTGKTATFAAPNAVPVGYETNCALQDSLDQWTYSRQWFCYIDFNVVLTTVDVETGFVLGWAYWTINHATGINPNSGKWSNFTSYYIEFEGGDEADIPDIGYDVNLCGGCNQNQVGYPFPKGPEKVRFQKASVGYDILSDNPAAGAVDSNLLVSWTDTITCKHCENTITQEYVPPSPVFVRCDALAGFNSPIGCTDQGFDPTFIMSGLASGNTSEYMIKYFQETNVDHWGVYPNGTPLVRLYNPTRVDSNRRLMCSGFVLSGPGDSCDEFPFASTYHSGPQLYGSAFTPTLCSQFDPVWNGGLSYTINASPGYSTSERCARAHVPLADNTDIGSQLSAFLRANRMIDGDSYWLYTGT